ITSPTSTGEINFTTKCQASNNACPSALSSRSTICLFINQPTNTAINNPPNGNISCEVIKSRKSKGVLNNKNQGLNSASALNDNTQVMPSSQEIPVSRKVAGARRNFLLST